MEVDVEGFKETIYEVECEFKNMKGRNIGIKLRKGQQEETLFYYDIENKKLILDRSNSGISFAEQYGTKRKCSYDSQNLKLQIFVDTSSVEIFVNDGEEVFTGRIFTPKSRDGIRVFAEGYGKAELKIWTLNI